MLSGGGAVIVIVVFAFVVIQSRTAWLFAGRGAEQLEEGFSELSEEEEINWKIRGRVDHQQQIREFANAFLEVTPVRVLWT